MDHSWRGWNRDKLEDIFYPKNVALIMTLKPVVDQEDFWVWDHTKSWVYSVKSGYWLGNRI